jgi:hypothetical protein
MRNSAVAVVVAIIVVAAAGYAFYRAAFPHETIRYRLTLEADVDGKLVTGSAVIQVTQYDTTAVFRNIGGAGTEVTGEAVVLDLGNRGAVFALLRGPKSGLPSEGTPGALLFKAYADAFGAESAPLARMKILQRERPRRDIPLSLIPMLVRFRNLNDPKSVEQVDPANLAGAFGSGVSLRKVTIEITDDRATDGIETKLPWLSTINTQLDGNRLHTGKTLANDLNSTDLVRKGR